MKLAINLSCLAIRDPGSEHMPYDEYQAAMIDGDANRRLVELLNVIGQGVEILVYTTMRESFSYQVTSWLVSNGIEADDVLHRPDDDYSRTAECVVEILDGHKIDFVIDNHPETCDALREEGFFVMEVM